MQDFVHQQYGLAFRFDRAFSWFFASKLEDLGLRVPSAQTCNKLQGPGVQGRAGLSQAEQSVSEGSECCLQISTTL